MSRFDEAVFSDPETLPITSMVFLSYEQGQREESEGRITLGPLTCAKEGVLTVWQDWCVLYLLVVMVARKRSKVQGRQRKQSRRKMRRKRSRRGGGK